MLSIPWTSLQTEIVWDHMRSPGKQASLQRNMWKIHKWKIGSFIIMRHFQDYFQNKENIVAWPTTVPDKKHNNYITSFSSRSHLVVASLRQTQFSSSQFCHGLHLLLFIWRSCLGWHSPSISASVFLFFFSQVVPSPESFFRRSHGLASLRGQTTSVLLSCISLW